MKKAYYRMIPCYYNPDTNELQGRNWIFDLLVDLNLWLDVYVFMVEEFPIVIVEDDTSNKNKNND